LVRKFSEYEISIVLPLVQNGYKKYNLIIRNSSLFLALDNAERHIRKNGLIDDSSARIGWFTFSKTAQTIYYRDKSLKRIKGGGISVNYFDESTGDEYYVSCIKKLGSKPHVEPVKVVIDDDALNEYKIIIGN
jgi:hypothetical protein